MQCFQRVQLQPIALECGALMTAAAQVRGLDGVTFYDGRLTVKEDVKSSFMLTAYNGILAEFKIVGSVTAKARLL